MQTGKRYATSVCNGCNGFVLKTLETIKDGQVVEATLAFQKAGHDQTCKSTDCTSNLNKIIYLDSEVAKLIKWFRNAYDR